MQDELFLKLVHIIQVIGLKLEFAGAIMEKYFEFLQPLRMYI